MAQRRRTDSENVGRPRSRPGLHQAARGRSRLLSSGGLASGKVLRARFLQRYPQGDRETDEIVGRCFFTCFLRVAILMIRSPCSAIVWGSSAKHARGQKVGLDHILEDEDGKFRFLSYRDLGSTIFPQSFTSRRSKTANSEITSMTALNIVSLGPLLSGILHIHMAPSEETTFGTDLELPNVNAPSARLTREL